MIRTILWAIGILTVFLLLQTTLVSYLVVWGIKPNLLLIVFVVLATQNGSFTSQLIGFALGFTIDTITTAPLGFNCFLYSLAGYLFGLGSGKVFLDPFVMPAFLGILATLFEAATSYLLNEIFRLGEPITAFFHLGLLIQIPFHALLMAVAFWVYGGIRERFRNPRRGFGG